MEGRGKPTIRYTCIMRKPIAVLDDPEKAGLARKAEMIRFVAPPKLGWTGFSLFVIRIER